VYLIWKLHGEWRIRRNADPAHCHTTSEIQNRWLTIINTRFRLDCLLTDSCRYRRKALPCFLVQSTWQGTLLNEPDLPDDWRRLSGFSEHWDAALSGPQSLVLLAMLPSPTRPAPLAGVRK